MAIASLRAPELRKGDPNPQEDGRSPSSWAHAGDPAQDDELLLEQEILRDHRPHATGTTELRGGDRQVKPWRPTCDPTLTRA